MSKIATVRSIAQVTLAVVLTSLAAYGQAPDWHRVGNALIDRGLAGLASGQVDRVWYSADGVKLLIRTPAGRVFETVDFERWVSSTSVAPPQSRESLGKGPEEGAVLARTNQAAKAYALGQAAYASDDGGLNWENLTSYRSISILGEGLLDLSVNPRNADDISVAAANGVFRSLDGGKSWSGLNQGLPNLQGTRIRALPTGERGVRIELDRANLIEWRPGERTAWQPAANADLIAELSLRQVLAPQVGGPITALEAAASANYIYVGTADGRLAVTAGAVPGTWQRFPVADSGGVRRFWIDPEDPRFALAVLDGRVLRTSNGGGFWDDLTVNLAGTRLNGVAVERSSGSIYLATAAGVFLTRTNLYALGPASPWTKVNGLPDSPVMDVQLNSSGTQLWALVSGFGTYSTLAPHRQTDPRMVSAADFEKRAAAPGALMSIAGAKVNRAQAGNMAIPVLHAGEQESQIQIPFDAKGDTLAISIDAAGVSRSISPVPLRNAAPAIFVDRDGAPILMDGESGMMLDAMHPAKSRGRIQILATGLGAVTPAWPTGLPAPLENPPQVSSPVRVWLDRTPLEVTRAVLAPSLTGFYLIEAEVPSIVNFGPAELYLETAGQASNKVRVYIEP